MNGPTSSSTEMCRARDPLLGVQCELVGPHERHQITGIHTTDGGTADRRWWTCNAPDPDALGRPCLRLNGHTGKCDGGA